MQIVPVNQIPKLEDIKDVSLENPIEVYKVCLEMVELCKKSGGVGLAAVQVGLPWKLFVVQSYLNCPFIEKGKFGYFVNCEYTGKTTEKTLMSLEGCLSIRSDDGQLRHFEVARHEDIILTGYRLIDTPNLRFEKVQLEVGVDQQSVVFQHEIDHQRDVLISTIGKEKFIW